MKLAFNRLTGLMASTACTKRWKAGVICSGSCDLFLRFYHFRYPKPVFRQWIAYAENGSAS